mmetsp:Transcript_32199/g.91728  ORF Transcript_32199/g.91728 Transcript_32199/m.91728 type:complete len:234 (+) Transcript_32199:1-702(+)
MATEQPPAAEREVVSLPVDIPEAAMRAKDHLGPGIRDLYRRGLLADVSLLCQERAFPAHRAVLSAQSDVFKERFSGAGDAAAPRGVELRLQDIANPEAVKLMLDHLYQVSLDMGEDHYSPPTQEVNQDVLRLAGTFRLPGLAHAATAWLAKDLTTQNVVERLKTCDDFGLEQLQERILEQLTLNKRALAEVVTSPQIMSYPKLMQSMLQLAASLPEEPAPAAAGPAKKKGRRA